ncbi:hypothetical protein PAI11_07510 [Patulibacter medicamentivorans]|uniref:Uncharacterized protein n=1 Tax=Patulibacter medicamentivorans TaxID=1097667 RepID=H0E1T9_9ACTN|nr:hypothetical protein PAI11_07510 [Patulibacter medicamentivorans]
MRSSANLGYTLRHTRGPGDRSGLRPRESPLRSSEEHPR